MPGMRLDFLKNPAQRVATGKSLPLKQVEAIVLYGKPAQRAKVVQKLLPAVYGLSLNKTTHHILLTLLDHCDNMDRVKMLYHVRRKLLDLAQSPVGNSVLQRMLEKMPVRQKKDIAEAFVLNVDEDEFKRLCEHPFGNHVAQKLMEVPECVEVVLPHFLPHLKSLSFHLYGMRVVSKYVESVADGCSRTVEALFPSYAEADPEGDEAAIAASDTLDKAVQSLFRFSEESLVLTALLRHIRTPVEVKDAMAAHLSEYAADYLLPPTPVQEGAAKKGGDDEEDYGLPDFGLLGSSAKLAGATNTPTNVHVYCAILEHGDDVQRADVWAALSTNADILHAITHTKGAVLVGVAAVRFVEAARKTLLDALLVSATATSPSNGNDTGSSTASAAHTASSSKPPRKASKRTTTTKSDEAAFSSHGDTAKSSIVDVATDPVRSVLLRTFVEVARDTVTEKHTQLLVDQAVTLAQNSVSSPVLQKLVETDLTGGFASALLAVLLKSVEFTNLVTHPAASFLLQSILQFSPEGVRAPLVEALSNYYAGHLHEALSHAQGSRVMQKLLAYAPDVTVIQTVHQLISDAAKEEEEVVVQAKCTNGSNTDAVEAAAAGHTAKTTEATKVSRKEQRVMNRSKHYEVLSHALLSYALHTHACYVIRALLREVRTRQLDRERKLLMNELKPHVFELAVSPWAGRVVLDAMMTVGSAQLADAMKNVAFLRAEEWLSDVSEKKRHSNSVDPTLRNILKRQREEIDKGVESKSTVTQSSGAEGKGAPAHKKKRLFRSVKK
uniref:Pumilio/PUF RNA binding protein 7, putative n=1 Tax=Leishmania guyanensis TaxID=5670 RepID=A0A1E1J3T3_LEIGU|nr:pumilio/PUF RNA binding protein 7, putative [Leishmania guyanensis]